MLLKDFTVETELGKVKILVAHCDYCGRKHFAGSNVVGGANDWLEIRRLDLDLPPVHYCSLDHLAKGVQVFQKRGITVLERGNWPLINGICTTAVGEEQG